MKDMIIESRSRFNFEETLKMLNEQIALAMWRIPATHDLQLTIKNIGKEILPVKVIELCLPAHSSKILELDNERVLSALMPCRISIYEKSDGKVYLSRLNSGMLAASLGGVVAEVMATATNDIEKMLQPIVN